MSIQEKNLLALIDSDPHHPFNFLKISDDFSGITTFSGKGVQPRMVYSGKRNCLEVLAREIFLNTYLRDDKEYYAEETIDSELDSYRSDLVTKLHDTNTGKQNIIEFKEVNSDIKASEFHTYIDNAFSQVKNKYITKKDEDLFVSVVLMDVDKIVKSPINLEKFITMQDKEKIKDQLNKNNTTLFKKFGISIVTKKFVADKNDYSQQVWFHIPKHCLIEVNHAEYDLFDLPQKVANVKDAIKFPTSSSSYGIKNVRDIKDPVQSDQKKHLLIEIMTTAVESFRLNDPSLVNKYGKEKDFVFIKDESVIKKYKHKDTMYYSLTTMNGAIVDGQNSIDCFKIILEFFDNILNKEIKIMPKYYDKMEKILNKNNIDSPEQRSKLKKFIEDLKITIKTTETDSVKEAVNIAVNKNNTMPVTSNELVISRNSEQIYIIGNAILEKSNIILGYPKRQYFGVSDNMKESSVIECAELAKSSQVYAEILENQNFPAVKVFAYKNKMVAANARNAISYFCENYSKEVYDADSIIVKRIDSKIETTTQQINDLKIVLKTLKSNNCPPDVIEDTVVSINEQKDFLKEHKKQREFALIKTYEACDTQTLINISNALLRIKWYIKNINQFVPSDIVDSLRVSKDNTFVCYCYILLLKNSKSLNLASKPIKDQEIERIVVKFFYNYFYFSKKYPAINITGINHNTSPDATTTDVSGNIVFLSNITSELFDVTA